MSKPHTPLPSALGTAFSVAHARACGLTENRLRSSDLEAPFWGVRKASPTARPAPDGIVDLGAIELRRRIDAYSRRLPPGRFFAGLAALVLWCDVLPVPSPLVEVGAFAPQRAPRAEGVRGRQYAPHMVTLGERNGLSVSSPASTWALLATTLGVRDLVAVGSLLVTAPRGLGGRIAGPALASIDDLLEAAQAGPRWGVGKLRQALPLVREGVRSRPEGHLLYEVLSTGLPEPELDQPMYDENGALIGIADMLFRAQRVWVEYQGDYHRTSREAWHSDIRKIERLREAGFTPVQLVSADLYPNPNVALARIRRALGR